MDKSVERIPVWVNICKYIIILSSIVTSAYSCITMGICFFVLLSILPIMHVAVIFMLLIILSILLLISSAVCYEILAKHEEYYNYVMTDIDLFLG